MSMTMNRSALNTYVTRSPKGSLTPQSASHDSGTPQTQKIVGQEARQTVNSAGGVSYKIDPWQQLDRFLILGTEGGTYYASERKLTLDNAKVVRSLIDLDGVRVVRTVVQMSENNRAPKADPGLFCLALCLSFGDKATKRAVHEALPKVARIGTHLFTFVGFAQQFRGWGRALREAVANWYTTSEKNEKMLAYGAVKYQSRNGFSNRDLLRLSHAKTSDPLRNQIFHWMVKGWESVGDEPHPDYALRQIWAWEKAKQATKVSEIVTLIRDYNLPREAIPTQWLKEKTVWDALLHSSEGSYMPLTAMIRNLATMSRVGLLTPMSEAGKVVCEQLTNAEALKKARIHPLQVLSALRVYAAGGTNANGYTVSRSHGGTFEPLPQVSAALEKAFYLSFGNVEPTGKRTLLALDVSGSMGSGEIAGIPGLTPREAEAALAMVTVRSEWSHGDISYPLYHAVAFDGGMKPLTLAPTDSLATVTKTLSQWSGGRTDCSLPFLYAREHNIPVDTFIIMTDNETYFGKTHPSEALNAYRKSTGIPARSIVVAFTSTGYSIADPEDAGSLDLVGFDSAAPALMSAFSRGEL